MKHLLLTTIAAVVLVGYGKSQPPEPPDISVHEAAEAGNIEVVKYHLAVGVDVNAPDVIKRTPLAYAASEGHKEIAKLLIDKGADVNGMVLDALNPLFSALTRGHKEIVELLLEKGADANVADQHGETALDRSKPETVAILSKHGGKTGEDLGAKPWNWKEMETVARELLGTYEWKHGNEQLGFKTGQMILLRDGMAQYKVGGTQLPEEKWKLKY